MLLHLNRQYHSQINQRPVAQGASEYVDVNSENSASPTYDLTYPTHQSSDF